MEEQERKKEEENNNEKKEKICIKCGVHKEIGFFTKNHHKNRKSYGTPTNTCKKCEGKRKRKLPSAKRIKAKSKGKSQRFIFDYLLDKSCKDCQETNVLVLQFDHLTEIYEKKYEISELVKKGRSLETIQKEIGKCDIVCANCHTIRTMRRGNHSRYRLAKEKGLVLT